MLVCEMLPPREGAGGAEAPRLCVPVARGLTRALQGVWIGSNLTSSCLTASLWSVHSPRAFSSPAPGRWLGSSDLSPALCQLCAGHWGAVAGSLTEPLGLSCEVPKSWGPSSSSYSHEVPSMGLHVREGCCHGGVMCRGWRVASGSLGSPLGRACPAHLRVPEPTCSGPQPPLLLVVLEVGYRVCALQGSMWWSCQASLT